VSSRINPRQSGVRGNRCTRFAGPGCGSTCESRTAARKERCAHLAPVCTGL
jgi:hypothetical protein